MPWNNQGEVVSWNVSFMENDSAVMCKERSDNALDNALQSVHSASVKYVHSAQCDFMKFVVCLYK